MEYVIQNGRIRAVVYVIKYSYDFKSRDNLVTEKITGERYVLKGEDYNKILKEIQGRLLGNSENGNVAFVVEDVKSRAVNYDGVEAAGYEEAEIVLRNLTLEEQLIEAQYEIDKMKLLNETESLLP